MENDLPRPTPANFYVGIDVIISVWADKIKNRPASDREAGDVQHV